MRRERDAFYFLLLATAAFAPVAVTAQDATTYGEALNVPVFERIDENGVDLISGMPRISGPVMVTGSGEIERMRGLQWTGKAWSIIGQPTIWRDGDKYIVNYRGRSEEFNDRSRNYSQRKPITGAKLSCSIYEPGNVAAECTYTDRDGDIVHFKGRYSNITPYPSYYGQSTYAWGNIGMAEARVYSFDRGFYQYGAASIGGLGESYYNRTKVLRLDDQSLTITTANHDDDIDEHYLRPKNTTQTITDSVGSVWQYSFNDNRKLTRVTPPGGTSSISFNYNSNGKVASVTNAAGTWTYSYTTPGDYGTTTVTSPLGGQTYFKYHRSRGHMTEYRDPLGRATSYEYDSGYRLSRVTYPEQNYVDFVYDARGNIVTKTVAPKPSVGGALLRETAGYDVTCTDPVTCNQPRHLVDARGSRTDFEYATSGSGPVFVYSSPGHVQMRQGTGKPVVVTGPAPAPGSARPQTRNTYSAGMLTRSATCLLQETCAGTADEVVTTYDYGGTRLLFGKAVTWQGATLRTCYGYDLNGRRISETPAIAGLSSCSTGFSAAPAVNSTMPSAGTAPVVPTFPDGSAGGGGGGGGGDDPWPPYEDCGPGTGKICP